MNRRAGEVIIVGASYAGLCAASAFQAKGWKATVLERSLERQREGGGVVVQKRMGEYLEAHGLASPGVKSVPARKRRLFQQDGAILELPETARSYTAWDILLHEFEDAVGEEHVLRGRGVTDVNNANGRPSVTLDDGSTVAGDFIIAADGVGSRIRTLMLPDARPEYAGYVAWRGTVEETELPSSISEEFQDSFCSYGAAGTNIVAYEIPGGGGSVEPGRRRVNWVWYVNVSEGPDLEALLTDRNGTRRHSTLQRGAVRQDSMTSMVELARSALPDPFARMIAATPEPFIQSILDLLAPRLVFGSLALIGDAASLIRPHLGSGSAKAVEDAVSLADAVCAADADQRGCTMGWELVRLEAHESLAAQAKAVARRYWLGAARSPA